MAGNSKSKAYVYRAPNGSWLYEKVLSPYIYNGIVQIFPMWLHPNAITLCGFICASTSLVITALYLPKFEDKNANLESVADASFYMLIAMFHALYTIFDNTDGKQARRTKTSSAAGEIFDHGVDQSVSSIAMIITSACLKLTYTQAAGMLLFGHTCTFMNNWYHKVTGVMSWGGRYLSVDEACLVTIAIALGAGLYGPSIYHGVILSDVPNPLFYATLSEESEIDVTFGNSLCVTSIGYGIYDTFVKLWLSFSIAADKGEVWKSFYSLLPFAYFLFFSGINFCVGATEDDAKLPQLVLTGTVYSIIGLRLIISMSIAQNTLFFAQHNMACAMGLVVLCLQALVRLNVIAGKLLLSADGVTWMMVMMLFIHFTTFAYALTTYNSGKPLFVMQKQNTA